MDKQGAALNILICAALVLTAALILFIVLFDSSFSPFMCDSVNSAATLNDIVSTSAVNKEAINAAGNAVAVSEDKININTANFDELMSLNGIGEVLAQRIINYRNENGYFDSIDELLNVNGIGEKTFEAVKDKITVS